MLNKSVFSLKVEEEEKLSCILNDRITCFQNWSTSSHIPLGIKLATHLKKKKKESMLILFKACIVFFYLVPFPLSNAYFSLAT